MFAAVLSTRTLRRAVALRGPFTVALRPSEYLKLRRQAAGLSVAEVAARLARAPAQRAEAAALVHLLESGGAVARHPETLERLRSCFPFDPDVYRQLATEPADRHPSVCRGCGCSHWDPCTDEHSACAWSTGDRCTTCERYGR